MSKRPPYNDWQTPLDEKKLAEFAKKVRDMARMEFGVDGDGDAALEVRFTDRTRGRSDPFQQLPYGHKSDEDRKAAFEAAVFNLHVAHATFETEDRVRRAHEAEEKRAEKKP